MQLVNEGNECRRRQYDEQDMAHEEVGTPKGHLHDLDDELTRRLRESGASEATPVPLARPPRTVSLVVLVLTREEHRDEDLVQRALDEDDRDETEHGVRRVPELEEPLK